MRGGSPSGTAGWASTSGLGTTPGHEGRDDVGEDWTPPLRGRGRGLGTGEIYGEGVDDGGEDADAYVGLLAGGTTRSGPETPAAARDIDALRAAVGIIPVSNSESDSDSGQGGVPIDLLPHPLTLGSLATAGPRSPYRSSRLLQLPNTVRNLTLTGMDGLVPRIDSIGSATLGSSGKRHDSAGDRLASFYFSVAAGEGEPGERGRQQEGEFQPASPNRIVLRNTSFPSKSGLGGGKSSV